MPEATLTTPAATPSQHAATSTPAASSSPAAAPTASLPSETPSQPASSTPAASPQNLVSGAATVALDIPDKFKVVKEDGSIDHEATLTKALGSYVQLEKRFSSGDVPPETEAGYKLDYSVFPEGIKVDPEGEKTFLKKMHGSGMTNKQVQAVVNEYGALIKQGLETQKKQATEQTAATLKDVATELSTTWGANFTKNQSAAIRGFNHLADATDKADQGKIGVDAKATYRILMKVLAKVGAGITEDTQIVNADGAGGLNETLMELRSSKAYTDENDPQHKATVAKVTVLYQRMYPNKQ
jgi:hypothetical protein